MLFCHFYHKCKSDQSLAPIKCNANAVSDKGISRHLQTTTTTCHPKATHRSHHHSIPITSFANTSNKSNSFYLPKLHLSFVEQKNMGIVKIIRAEEICIAVPLFCGEWRVAVPMAVAVVGNGIGITFFAIESVFSICCLNEITKNAFVVTNDIKQTEENH